MVSMKEQHHHIAQDAAVDRVNQAFERLQIAWHTVRARRTANGTTLFDAAAINELDAAEEEWLAARAAASFSHCCAGQIDAPRNVQNLEHGQDAAFLTARATSILSS